MRVTGCSDASSEDSDLTLTEDHDGLDIDREREAGSLYHEELEDLFLNIQTDVDVELSPPRLLTEAKNGFVDKIDRVWAHVLRSQEWTNSNEVFTLS
jgi:hypothetical protein